MAVGVVVPVELVVQPVHGGRCCWVLYGAPTPAYERVRAVDALGERRSGRSGEIRLGAVHDGGRRGGRALRSSRSHGVPRLPVQSPGQSVEGA